MSSDLARQTRDRQAQNSAVAERAQDLIGKIYGQRSEISKALAERIGAERFLRAVATEIRTTEHLAECSPDSVLGGLYVAAQLGLEVGGPRGLVYLVPYKRKGGGYEASLIVGYKGWVELFYRAGAKAVQWFLIREGDTFRIGSDPVRGKIYAWEQADPNSTRPVTGAVAQVVTAGGGIVWEYLSRADIEKRSTDTPFWRKWWDEMALKTVLRRLAATAPASTELQLAQRADETVQRRVAVPGMATEQLTEHVPLAGTRPAVEQRPAAPPVPRPGPRPAAPTTAPAAPQPSRQAADPMPDADEPFREQDFPGFREPSPDAGDDADWEAREREEHAAWLAAQQDAEADR